ncbi:hypothetical protein PDESU_00349 [Pontiella desulfatans]|uniref:Uncharacterized protein n=1 Tax=Pontiella desulfatans TaxID=2750659 RepID=A0A6C2TW87_PONDE|nr:GEVED domain-containing protein [Pontiella desulfatans]VGO11802.1 hypothetical protein PDESU_00349 [Pontiella desulfatans]
MKAQVFRTTALLIAALSIAAVSLQAAPSLPITKPPVQSTGILTGPMQDPAATNGQWFLDLATGDEEYRPYEFHDNLLEYGGGNAETYAIEGIVPPGGIQYATGASGGYGDPIIGFKIDACIYNDTLSTFGDASASDNSHGESRQPMAEDEFYAGTLVDTKLTADFAIADTGLLPNAFTGPYNQPPYPSWIIADNEDELAWYCWSPADPPANQEVGNYYVPTWDFGDIPVYNSTCRTLDFTVDPPMDPTDPRYDLLYASQSDGIDLFANRTTSLKISTWIDLLGDDSTYTPYPEPPARSSDVSVFHDEPPPYEPTHKMHWPQLPDPNGWDVRASYHEWGPDQLQKVLADDFQCSANGPITKITFWGSFEFDGFNPSHEYGGITNFHLSLHKDIPADPPWVPYSMPVIPSEWEFDLDPFNLPAGWAIEVTAEAPSSQGWYDPNHDTFEENNHSQYFRYDVTIPVDDAFVQTEGEIYWLDISVMLGESEALWGWKTSGSEHFNDDGVWADLPVTNLAQWKELRDPLTGESLDLAFVIDGGDPDPDPYPDAKWFQPPDLSSNGFDVACRLQGDPPILLADDFLCTNHCAITNIIVWGSWLGDELPMIDGIANPSNVSFTLSFHADLPAGTARPWSIPGSNLWVRTFNPSEFSAEPITFDGMQEGWYDPPSGTYIPNADWTCWQYTFPVDLADAFVQTGTVDRPIIYWLDVQAHPIDEMEEARFGWKTTPPDHQWNDDAAWSPNLELYNGYDWFDLHYPPGHPYHQWEDNSFDLAFALFCGPEEQMENYDWGDAPDAAGAVGFNTLAANTGANHAIIPGFMLGNQIDGEPDGQPTPPADGDDINILYPGVPYPAGDEDGVVFTSAIVPGLNATLQVTMNGAAAAMLDAWMDLDGSGTWTAGDQIFSSHVLNPGANSLSFPVPNTAVPGTSYARFRLSTTGGLSPIGYAPDGEVEDYQFIIEDPIDWGDAPDTPYPTLSGSGGANHYILGGGLNPTLGAFVDPEPDGQPTPGADGDDLDALYPSLGDDEDGVTFLTPLIPGAVAQVNVVASGPAGFLQCWVDANGNGFWGDPGEQVLMNVSLAPGNNLLSFVVPPNGTGASVPAGIRFRYSSVRGLPFSGTAPDGEVEDYMEEVYPDSDIDWGDAPTGYPTLAANNGAHHLLGSPLFLGKAVDPEQDGQPSINADGDDANLLYPGIPYPPGDEDGVILTCPLLMPGGYASVNVIASQPGMLDAWVDFNADGSWAQAGDQIFSGQPLAMGTNSLFFPVPLTASWGPGYSRFRLSGAPSAYPASVSYTGLCMDGEVEDYEFLIKNADPGRDFGDAPNSYPTLLPTGARHTIVAGVMLGAVIDPEPDGQPSAATLDDTTGLDDEDGISFGGKIVAGSNATIIAVAGVSGGNLDAWIDFNNDGSFAGEHLWLGSSQWLNPGANSLTFAVPGLPAQALGPSMARFRISTAGGLAPSGPANDGEVEDYGVKLFQPAPTNLVITKLTFNTGLTVSTNEWTVENGIQYQLETKTNLLVSPWIPTGSPVIGPVNWQTNNISAERVKFYRVTVPWTP